MNDCSPTSPDANAHTLNDLGPKLHACYHMTVHVHRAYRHSRCELKVGVKLFSCFLWSIHVDDAAAGGSAALPHGNRGRTSPFVVREHTASKNTVFQTTDTTTHGSMCWSADEKWAKLIGWSDGNSEANQKASTGWWRWGGLNGKRYITTVPDPTPKSSDIWVIEQNPLCVGIRLILPTQRGRNTDLLCLLPLYGSCLIWASQKENLMTLWSDSASSTITQLKINGLNTQ